MLEQGEYTSSFQGLEWKSGWGSRLGGLAPSEVLAWTCPDIVARVGFLAPNISRFTFADVSELNKFILLTPSTSEKTKDVFRHCLDVDE